MAVLAAWRAFRAWLETWPSVALTLLLLAIAAVIVMVALRGNALEKALVAAWTVAP